MPTALKRRKVATRFERKLAEDVEGKRVFLSGAGPEKGDVRKRSATGIALRIEAKTTEQAAYTFSKNDWVDLMTAADKAAENPVFAIKFLPSGVSQVIIRRGFARAIGLEHAEASHTMVRSYRITPVTHATLHLKVESPRGTRNEELWVLAYDKFLEALHDHEP